MVDRPSVVSVEGGGNVDVGARVIQWSANDGQEQGWKFGAIYIDA
ncbi:hypothetical protein [Micromonospora gifhornensis]